MKILYVELKEAVSIPGNYGLRLFTLRGKAEEGPDGHWFSFEKLPDRTLLCRYKGQYDIVVVTPYENVKQMHAHLPLPAPEAPAPKGKH